MPKNTLPKRPEEPQAPNAEVKGRVSMCERARTALREQVNEKVQQSRNVARSITSSMEEMQRAIDSAQRKIDNCRQRRATAANAVNAAKTGR